MSSTSLRLAALLAAALLLCACAPQPRHVLFNEAAFGGYAGSGSSTISGMAFTVLRGNKYERAANHHATIKLVPANAYTEEIMTRRYHNRIKLEPADPGFAKYVRRTHPDDEGNFTFTHVPAGRYYVSCHLRWDEESSYTDSDGTIWPTTVDEDQWIYADVSVGQGQTARVESWNQGK